MKREVTFGGTSFVAVSGEEQNIWEGGEAWGHPRPCALGGAPCKATQGGMHCPSARALAKLPENPEFLPCKDCEQLAGLREKKELQDTPTAQVSVVLYPRGPFQRSPPQD